MFESLHAAATLAMRVREFGAALVAYDGRSDSGSELVALISELERLKGRAEGAQVAATAALDADQRAEQAGAGVPADRQGKASDCRWRSHDASPTIGGRVTSAWRGR